METLNAFCCNRLGQRVMKTQDGTADVCRDHTFLAESGLLPKVTCKSCSSMHSAQEAHGRLSAAAAYLVPLLLTHVLTFCCKRCIICTMHGCAIGVCLIVDHLV